MFGGSLSYLCLLWLSLFCCYIWLVNVDQCGSTMNMTYSLFVGLGSIFVVEVDGAWVGLLSLIVAAAVVGVMLVFGCF